MSLRPRPYQGLPDFISMISILEIGRKTAEHSHYVHIGDLSWWMFYSDHNETHWRQHICLWDHNGHPIGWSLLDPDWHSFDVFLLPEWNGSLQEATLLDWSIKEAVDSSRKHGIKYIQTMWVSEDDQNKIGLLTERGFSCSKDFMWCLECSLDRVPKQVAPDLFQVRPIRGDSEVIQRAAASYTSFESTRDFKTYWPRYERFMRSPVYDPNFDLVVAVPDGSFAAFCIIWPDPVNHIGLFEPVGTRPQFQRRGLGKLVVGEGLHCLKACGMERAMVCVDHTNLAALKLYQAVGFTKKYKLYTFTKTI